MDLGDSLVRKHEKAFHIIHEKKRDLVGLSLAEQEQMAGSGRLTSRTTAMVPVARKSLYTATSYYFSDFPEHGVLFIAEDNFSIKEFYSELQAPTKDSADKAFRTIITSISQFTLTKKNEKLVSFANNVRTANFSVLESPEAYD